jgi:Domain of unknown function (DUF6265)
MKQFLFIWYILFICSPNLSAQNFSTKDFQQLSWILGSWKMQIKNGFLYEQWHTLNDSTLQSKGFIIKTKGDTVLLESVQIALRNNKLYYISTVNGQNNNEAVPFTFTLVTINAFTAENPAHDFPQKIYYKAEGDKKLYAVVSGIEKKQFRKEEFRYMKE